MTTDSWATRLPVGLKLATLFGLSITTVVLHGVPSSLGLLALVLLLAVATRVPGRTLLRTLRGILLFAVGRLTKLLSPVYVLKVATAKGDREALRLLSAHDSAARKLSAHHGPEPEHHRPAGR